MIADHCFARDWIEKKRIELRVVDAGLLEKCIHAFELLGRFSKGAAFDFVFKGGTSLILLLERLKRLSIDIDIASTASPEKYEAIFPEICKSGPFLRYEEDHRGENRLPRRRHFKFFYRSLYSQREDHVLLDILEEENVFPETRRMPIRTSFIETQEEATVLVPTVDCLLGDKLTAFAPDTIGVPLVPAYSMQVAKQIFDVGELFDTAIDLELIKRTYSAISVVENGYRGSRFTTARSLDDTLETSYLIGQSRLRGGIADGRTVLINEGIRRIQSHLAGPPYRLDDARVSSSKAACLAAAIRQDRLDQPLADFRFTPERINEVRESRIERWPVLNRLKAIRPEAFYYWMLVERIL